MDVDARVEALEAENERLRDEIDRLKEALGQEFVAPVQFRLTAAETKVFGRLLRGGLVTKDALMAVLYRDTAKDEAEIKVVDVFVYKLRKKLKPFGLEIATRWGAGYEMSAEMIRRFKDEWAQAVGVAA